MKHSQHKRDMRRLIGTTIHWQARDPLKGTAQMVDSHHFTHKKWQERLKIQEIKGILRRHMEKTPLHWNIEVATECRLPDDTGSEFDPIEINVFGHLSKFEDDYISLQNELFERIDEALYITTHYKATIIGDKPLNSSKK